MPREERRREPKPTETPKPAGEVPVYQLELAYSSYHGDLFKVGTDPNCHPDVLRLLAEHKDCGVRSLASVHKNTPSDVLKKLENDEHPTIRENAKKSRGWR